MKLTLITFPYSTDADSNAAKGPDALLQGGVPKALIDAGHDVADPVRVELADSEKTAYGAWNRIGLANGRLAAIVAKAIEAQSVPLILESNCYAALGVLAGLLTSGASPNRIGMVWIDAHGDCNTPETTLSGMLSGMPVAVATGQCLHRLRQAAGLDLPIDPANIVMVCVRANDPLEQELIERLGIERVPVADIKRDCRQLRAAMARLSRSADAIYVHFDIDALDQSELASTRLAEPGGPARAEMAAALELALAHPEVKAWGVSDFNPERDVEGRALQAILEAIRGGALGIARRDNRA